MKNGPGSVQRTSSDRSARVAREVAAFRALRERGTRESDDTLDAVASSLARVLTGDARERPLVVLRLVGADGAEVPQNHARA
jgi:hypothetical protein